ncbi:MAG: hypothetical protein ACLUNZ_02590 [Evtepia sp.]
MEIDHHIAEAQALLEEVLAGAPDVARFDRLEVRQERALVQKLVDGGQLALDGAVVDQNICVFWRCRRPIGSVVVALKAAGFEIAEGIGPPGQLDGLATQFPGLRTVTPPLLVMAKKATVFPVAGRSATG